LFAKRLTRSPPVAGMIIKRLCKVHRPMALKNIPSVAVVATIWLGGCAFADVALFPPLTQPSAPKSAAAPAVLASAEGPSEGAAEPTGTFVGQKVESLRNDKRQLEASLAAQKDQLQQILDQIAHDSQTYHGTVAVIQERLQIGTTPGNPILVQQWNDAQSALDAINEDVLKMSRLATDVASTSGMAAYLLESIRAARSLSGAVDEDYRNLRSLEDETNGTTLMIERVLTELSTDVQRQQQYLANERSNLNGLALAIKSGQFIGNSLAFGHVGIAPPVTGAPVSTDRPLVVIRFDKAHVPYEDALYTAVKSALDRRPSAVFDVIGVTPVAATPGATALGETSARRNADTVVRSLTQMGLPADRVRASASSSSDAGNGEVRVFVR